MRRSPLFPIFLIVLVDVFGLTLVIPLLAFYAEHFGATPMMATSLVSSYAACQFFSAPVLGNLSDRFGRKRLLLVSQLGTFIGFLVLARADALWMVFLGRAIDGATAGNLTIAQAYISDNTTRQQRTLAFAMIGIAFGVGFFLGPAVSGTLAHAYGLAAPIYLAAGLSFTSILCTGFLLPTEGAAAQSPLPPAPSPGGEGEQSPPREVETYRVEASHPLPSGRGPGGEGSRDEALPGGRRPSPFAFETYVKYFSRPVLGGLFVQFLFFSLAFSTFTSGFALFSERRFTWEGHPFTTREVGFVFAYVGFLGIIIQGGLIRRMVPRFGEPVLVAVGFLTMGAGYAALSQVSAIGMLLVVSSVSSFGNAILRPALSSLITHAAGRGEQGIVLGLMQSLGSIAQIGAPLLGGFLIGRGDLATWALVAAGAALLGAVAGVWGSQRMPKHAAMEAKEA